MNTLKTAGIIGVKACRAIVYKTVDVVKMYNHWNIHVPAYLIDLSNGKVSPLPVIIIMYLFPM